MRKQKNNSINYDALKYLKLMLDPHTKIVDLYVQGKWLWAELNTGVRFGVMNKEIPS